ncbi:MAG: hypothetical protein RLZZ461_1379 [Planctomycetota bacterium]
MNPHGLVKAVAFVLWADDRITAEEQAAARQIFEKHGMPWDDASTMLDQAMEVILDEGDDGESESEGDELDFGVIDPGDADSFDLLVDLANLACADGSLDWSEIDVLHAIGRAMNQPPAVVSAALVMAVSSGAKAVLDSEVA